MRLDDRLERRHLVALLPDEPLVCGAFLTSGELVVAWDSWVHVFCDPHGDESVDWDAGEYVVAIQRAPEPGVAVCLLSSGTAIELRIERGIVSATPLDCSPPVEQNARRALPPIDGASWVVSIAATDDGRTILILDGSELIVADRVSDSRRT